MGKKTNIKSCDVVMPVYNNQEVLRSSLTSLFEQSVPPGWQVRLVVVDDGSSDNTLSVIEDTPAPSAWSGTLVIKQEHRGAARARNKGVEVSRADIIFFLGADIILRPQALKTHLTWHENNLFVQSAALGMVKWDPRIKPSPLMEWMVHGGQQNDFDNLIGRMSASPKDYFYGSHLSIKRENLEKFSDKFGSYGWEDLELGRRLADKGVELHVLHDALSLHHHYYKVEDILKRQYLVGQGVVKYQNLYPDQHILPKSSFWKHWRRLFIIRSGLLSLLGEILKKIGPKMSTPRLFLHITSLYFWQGVYSNKDYTYYKNSPK